MNLKLRLSGVLAVMIIFVLAAAGTASAGKSSASSKPVKAPAPTTFPTSAGGLPGQWFSTTSFWNTPVAADAPLDDRSAVWVQHLQDKVANFGSWINTTQYSVPIYTVPANQPLVPVKIDWPTATYDAEFEAGVPVPVGLKPAAGTDMRVSIWQPSTNTLWEMWQMRVSTDGLWHANTAGKMTNVSTSTGLYPSHDWNSPYGAAATELPITSGLITPDELSAGKIDHVLALNIPHPLLKWWWSFPATHSDGDSNDPFDIPEGARLRLPASLNVDALGLPRAATIIAKAAQKYGIVIRDKSDTVTFMAQDPLNLGVNPYPGLFGGLAPDQVLAQFPWGSLQVLKSQPNQPYPS